MQEEFHRDLQNENADFVANTTHIWVQENSIHNSNVRLCIMLYANIREISALFYKKVVRLCIMFTYMVRLCIMLFLHEIRLCANLTYMIRLCAMSYTKLLGKIVEKEGKFGFVSGCSYIIVPCLPTLTT